MAAAREIQVELLLGCKVLAKNGRAIGRIEEMVADERDGELVLRQYLLGSYAVLERLAVSPVARVFLSLLHLRTGYRVPWDRLDLSDVTRPRLTCALSELEKE
jgi:sporulation protein YlmC with PRC-barrel domain